MSRLNVLFLCTHNSARSILAEALLNHHAGGRVGAFSAGSHPSGQVHPLALRALAERGISVEGARSKVWDVFALPEAPRMGVVITVCDGAAGEMCPIWPGAPLKAHWGVAEPGRLAEGLDDRAALGVFRTTLERLERRVQTFLGLSLETLDPDALKRELDRIGGMD
ncbi:Arsenate reductase [Candidatus Magnetaquicoccaceae bacterium FCR-1]|uniref:Arsenate reductase n=1 Tax=Candidatus Magnetaquiglobus chichijimensis TaxID=3141448 RepID=A0ABQ0C611_9PROT